MKRLFLLLALPLLVFPAIGFAQPDYTGQLNNAGTAVYATTDPGGGFAPMLGTIIGAVLAFLGVILLVLIIYAGFLWMTASGNATRVQKAKDILSQAFVGLIIVLVSYALTRFVVSTVATIG